MTAVKKTQALKNKRERERVGRKVKTLLKKTHKLGKLPRIDVAAIICNRGRYSTYKSMNRESWPPTMTEVVSECRDHVEIFD